MGNENSTVAPKYPPGFSELHTKVDNLLCETKNDLTTQTRNKRRMTPTEKMNLMNVLRAQKVHIQQLVKKKSAALEDKDIKYLEEDVAKWTQMIKEVTELHAECEAIVKPGKPVRSRRPERPKQQPREADLEQPVTGRTGKLSKAEQKAMDEIEAAEAGLDVLAGEIGKNVDALSEYSRQIGEEIDDQRKLVKEVGKLVCFRRLLFSKCLFWRLCVRYRSTTAPRKPTKTLKNSTESSRKPWRRTDCQIRRTRRRRKRKRRKV